MRGAGKMPRTKDTEHFMKKLREIGGSAGNKALRETLNWPDEKYFRVRRLLIEEGLVEIGRGKGGSVYLLDSQEQEHNAGISKAELSYEKYEKDHYIKVASKIESQLKEDFEAAVVDQAAHQGGKLTGGKWSRPDILAVTVQKFEYIVEDEFLLRSYEVKRSDSVDTDAVAEAAAHRRLAQLAYLVIVPHSDDKKIFEPSNIRRRNIEKECLKVGVGLLLISDYSGAYEIEYAVDASNSNISCRDINSTIGRLFSEQKRKEIRGLIDNSRLGELRKLLPR
jgi:hypothetical protein